MSTGITDTSDAANAVQLRVLRNLGPEQRSQLGAQWSNEIREIAMQGIRDRHKEYDDRRVVLEYARLTLDERLFQDAFAAEAAKS